MSDDALAYWAITYSEEAGEFDLDTSDDEDESLLDFLLYAANQAKELDLIRGCLHVYTLYVDSLKPASFKALKKTYSKLGKQEEADSLHTVQFEPWRSARDRSGSYLTDWSALAALIQTMPSLHRLQVTEISGQGERRNPPVLPSSFLLSLRQQSFDLQLALERTPNIDDLLSTLQLQNQQTHSPPMCPFSIRSIRILSISLQNIVSLCRLGRSGPENVHTAQSGVFKHGVRDGTDSFIALLESNLWIYWAFSGEYWTIEPGDEDLEEDSDGEDYDIFDDEADFEERISGHNHRIQTLRDTTRSAASVLLQVARPLLLSSTPSSTIASASPANIQSLTSAQPRAASSSSLALAVFPILSLPYDVLDTVLFHLSSGCLSSKQHRLVMTFVEDRSTLGINKASSETDFLRRTNCYRWESEVESVNKGQGYD